MANNRWFVDRTRYEAGFTCPWRRYLGFHANTTGLSPKLPNIYQTPGILIHRGLETFLTTGQIEIPPVPPGVWDSDTTLMVEDTVDAGIRGWIHTTYPWFKENFDLVSVEEELTLDIDDPAIPIRWMARPDLVARRKSDGVLTVHDFKSVGSWRDDYLKEWGDSLQLMMNAHVAAQKYAEPVPFYYVHFIVRGTSDWPTLLTHAWYREPNPPLEPEDWRLKKPYGKSGHMYQKIRVRSKLAMGDWIPSLDPATLQRYFIIGGPFPVNPYKVKLFLQGLPANEWQWMQSIGTASSTVLNELGIAPDITNPKVRDILNSYFPRTFNCYTYNSRCGFYDLCLTPNTGLDRFEPRTPHHPTEGKLE